MVGLHAIIIHYATHFDSLARPPGGGTGAAAVRQIESQPFGGDALSILAAQQSLRQ